MSDILKNIFQISREIGHIYGRSIPNVRFSTGVYRTNKTYINIL